MTTQTDLAPADRTDEHPDAIAPTGDALRAMLRALASPVVVVTVSGPAGTRGATIGSFASVSLDPPLVSFNVTHGTQLHAALDDADAFAVHLLAADQADVATHFARPDLDAEAQTAGADLGGTLGTILCAVSARITAGDHTVVIGEVTDLVPGRDAAPLLYFQQSYRGVGGEV